MVIELALAKTDPTTLLKLKVSVNGALSVCSTVKDIVLPETLTMSLTSLARAPTEIAAIALATAKYFSFVPKPSTVWLTKIK